MGLARAWGRLSKQQPASPSRARRDGSHGHSHREGEQDETPWADPSAGWTRHALTAFMNRPSHQNLPSSIASGQVSPHLRPGYSRRMTGRGDYFS